MTLYIKENINRVYEIDLNFKTIIDVVSFIYSKKNKLFLTSDPFHATLTYVIDNYIYAVNTHYHNIMDEQLKASKNQHSFTDLGKNDNFFMDSAYCNEKKYGSFEFVITSSAVSGYESVQTYFIKSNSKYFQCIIYKYQCTCAPFKDLSIRDKFIQISDYYLKQNCGRKFENNSLVIENKVSHFGKQSKQLRECLRICSIPKWKQEINYEYTSSRLNCVNNLKLNSSLEQFGIALVKSDNAKINKIRVNYYKEFLEQLFDICSNYELMYKFSVDYSILNSILNINEIIHYGKVKSIESSIEIDLNPGIFYIFNVFIQTPFDNKAYNLGTFVLSDKFELTDETNFTWPKYQKILIDPIPQLFSKNWYEHVSANNVIFSFLSQSINLNSKLKYILTEVGKSRYNFF